MTRSLLLLPGLLLLCTPGLPAQQAPIPIKTVNIWPKGIPPEGIQQKDNYGDHVLSISHREKDGFVEQHEGKDDVMVIQSGGGTLVYGGKGIGMHPSAPHELQGERIEGGTSVQVGPGDVITIPAGVPHQFLVPAGSQVTYLLVKIVKP